MVNLKIKKVNYIDNKKMYEEIIKYKELVKICEKENKPKPRIPNFLGICIYKIAINLANWYKFVKYSFKDEMISDGIENAIMYFDNFDPVKWNNPLAYFTQIMIGAFIRRIGKEEKIRYAKYKFFQETFVNSGKNELLFDADDHLLSISNYDNIIEFMDKYEKKEEEKKKKRKEKKEQVKIEKELKNDNEKTNTDSDY